MPDTDVTNDHLVGSVVDGKYRIIKKIGAGGVGAVYKAQHMMMERVVALKVLHTRPMDPNDDEALRRFNREAKTASQINHPNAVTIHDYGIDGGLPYLVMTYIEGKTLKEIIAEQSPLKSERIHPIIEQICGAVSEAHRHGIVHRDLKPDNIMISAQGDGSEHITVLDFGIAKVFAQNGITQTFKTETGSLVGTPRYMAPEQFNSEPVDNRTDIYSLGIILYEMITGELPFRADSLGDLIVEQLTNDPQPMREFKPQLRIPAPLDDIVLCALEKDPQNRYQSVSELWDDLKPALNKGYSMPDVTPSGTEGSAFKQPVLVDCFEALG